MDKKFIGIIIGLFLLATIGFVSSGVFGYNYDSGDFTVVSKIKFLNNTLLTTPQEGVLEFYNNKLYITNVDTQRVIDRTSDVIISNVTVNNTVTETVFYRGTIDPDDLRVGNLIKVGTNGVASTANAAQVLTIRVYIGSTLISTSTETGSTLNNEPWDQKIVLTVRRTGVNGNLATHTDFDIGGRGTSQSSTQTSQMVQVDTTASEDITVTAQWSAANTANRITIYQGWLEYKN